MQIHDERITRPTRVSNSNASTRRSSYLQLISHRSTSTGAIGVNAIQSVARPRAPGCCDSGVVEISFVGSGDAFGNGGRFQTCIRLHGDEYTALVDCGATSLTAMKAQHVDPGEVDAVLLSHLHGDHFGGLPFLVLDGQFTRRTRPLTVLGPTGTAERLHAAMETLYPGSAAVQRRYPLRVVELDGGGRVEVGPLTVRSWQVDHASGAPALALQAHLGEARFGYSGDTAWTETVLDAADGTDVFACEAYTYQNPVRYHLDLADLRAHGHQLATGRLILTHLGPTMLARLNAIEYETAIDGLTVHT
jgi:ribonuclease BN (tRNA processing enzyme)